jgi:hypothetical protein
MLLYDTELRYDHGMAVNYHGKKLYNIGPRGLYDKNLTIVNGNRI